MQNYLLRPELNKNLITLPLPLKFKTERKTLVKVMAESIDTKTPIPNVRANPLISDVPNQNNIIAVIMFELFESRIDIQALENPMDTASDTFLPARNSSFTRSNMRTLASTAIPIEMMKPAIPAAVSVTGTNLNSASMIEINIRREIVATSPGNLYQRIRNRATNKNPMIVAFTPAATALSPSDAPIVCLDIRVIGSGKAP